MSLKDELDQFVSEYSTSRSQKETNIIYLTSRCNFRCDYCFEAERREKLKAPIDITYKEIDDFLDDIEWRETGQNSTVVFFGGEPLLQLDKIEYAIDSMLRRHKAGGWGWEITTNGYLLKDENYLKRIEKLLNIKNEVNGILYISFDVSGQYKRKKVGSNDNTFEDIYSVLRELNKRNIPFGISFTISDANAFEYKKDLVWLFNKLKVQRVVVNCAQSDIERKIGYNKYSEFKRQLELFCYALFEKYKVPLCDIVCDKCRKCKKVETSNNYAVPNKENIKEKKHTSHKFNKF